MLRITSLTHSRLIFRLRISHASGGAGAQPRQQAEHDQQKSTDPARIQLFQALNLSKFNDEEINRAYARLYGASWNDENPRTVDTANLFELLKANKIVIGSPPTKEEWSSEIKRLGEKLDPRVWPLGLSFLGTGLSIGIITPILPLLVESLKMPPSQFGLVVSAFGLAKLVGNIPSAHWVEKYGRKTVMVQGMVLCSIGIGSVGLAVDPNFGTQSLLVSRLITGFGVSAFTSAAFMMLADISTSLNRVRTMSPVMASFQAGTALGPAIGGLAVTQLGIGPSYFVVGGLIGGLAGLNHLLLRESKPSIVVSAVTTDKTSGASTNGLSTSSASKSSFSIAMKAWKELLTKRGMQDVVFANTMYWVGLSGTSLTLLPLYMVDLHLTAAQIGLCFAFSSSVSVAASQPTAYLADTWGKEKMIALGLGVLGSSMVLMPAATNFESLLCLLTPIALGSTVLSAVPAAMVGDIIEPSKRSQALALLRTAGDLGLLLGAIGSGFAAGSLTSIETTMEFNGVLLMCSSAIWATRRFSMLQK